MLWKILPALCLWGLTATTHADVIHSLTPPRDEWIEASPPLTFDDTRINVTTALTPVTSPPDAVFRTKRWPCIVKGAAWGRRQQKTVLPEDAALLIPLLKEAFATEGLPSQLAWVAEVESMFNTNAVSKTGAAGLFQFKAEAAKRFTLLKDSGDYRQEAEQSAHAAARYLAYLYSRFGDWTLAVAAYNAGEGYLERLMKKHKASQYQEIAMHLPEQTQIYVIKVMTTLALRENTWISALPTPTAIPLTPIEH